MCRRARVQETRKCSSPSHGSLLKVMLWSTRKKSRTGVLSLGVTHGACNEVWWSPYPTNLRPPYHGSLCHCDRDDHHSSSLPRADKDDSSYWHSSNSIDPKCDSVDAQCGMPQSHTGAMGQHCSRVELATIAVVDPRSTNPTLLSRRSPE